MCGASTSASSRFSGNSSNHSGKSRNRFPDAPSLSLSLFLFWVLGVSRQFPDRHFALAGLEDVLDESYDGDAEDELEPEFDDNPGTTRGTTFSVQQRIFFPCLINRGCLPLVHSQEYPWSLQSLHSNTTASVSSSSCTGTN